MAIYIHIGTVMAQNTSYKSAISPNMECIIPFITIKITNFTGNEEYLC